MKKILLVVVCLIGYYINAQDQQSENIIFTGTGAVQNVQHSNNLELNIQVGSPLLFYSNTTAEKTSFGYPYSILYVPNTFVNDKYEISKGYYSDRIRLSWEIGANKDEITNIQIFRTELGSNYPEQLIASVAKDVFEYNDYEAQSGQLYKYKIKAQGVSDIKEEEFFNFVEGIGFRNPTATVSGNISFEGGTPVKDVTVFADAQDATNAVGSSIYLNGGYVSTENLNKLIKAQEVTLQTWVTFKKGEDVPDKLFSFLTNSGDKYSIQSYVNTSNTLDIVVFLNGEKLYGVSVAGALPTGKIDPQGNDIYQNISAFTSNDFYHISIALEDSHHPKIYINSVEINAQTTDNVIAQEGTETPVITEEKNTVYSVSSEEKLQQIYIGLEATDTYFDEIRVWERILNDNQIRRDYRRYLNGGESGLKLYLRADEKAGEFLYDLSKVGYSQNENHAKILRVTNNDARFSNKTPESDQLGVFGVTDKNGSYIIAAIPYAGVGESFQITPSLGVHKFEPASQTLFLGKDEPVVNQVNFKDVSSFNFNGRVVYNVQGVFKPLEITTPVDLKESENYNQYVLGDALINKGQYYYEGGSIDTTSGLYVGGELKKYPVIPVNGATILIDGNIVLDADNQPVLSDEEGNFSIQVPIGNHKIEVQKEGHTFELAGRFPAKDTYTFFEDQIETRYFIDNTRVTLVGKVVGGKKEFEKPTGFGYNGKFTHTNFENTENQATELISSNNNIGVAQITFKGDVNSSDLDKIITTNTDTGEYKVALIPYQYQILKTGITIPSNTEINILDATETLDLREIPVLETSEATAIDGTVFTSDEYHYEKSFRYNSKVSLKLISQTFEKSITIENVAYDISSLDTPLYNQSKDYEIVFEVSQNYVNKDSSEEILTKEYYTEGAFNITNNLAAANSDTVVYDKAKNTYKYSFKGGDPNTSISDGFKKGMTIEYVIEGQNPITIANNNEFKNTGIIRGLSDAGGTAFSTIAPQVPDIILRDPPGSNSFTKIEAGTTISFQRNNKNELNNKIGIGVTMISGPSQEILMGSPGLMKSFTTEVVNNSSRSISMGMQKINDSKTLISYTFNQEITTSNDVDYVGADGDLYIGNATNIYYGIVNNMFVTSVIPKDNNGETIEHITVTVNTEEGEKTLYISSSKDYVIVEQPTNTFFTYSQKYILETLIPDLENLAARIDSGTVPDETKEYQSASYYTKQIELWKKVVQDNEKSKYEALHNKENLRNEILANVSGKYGDFELDLKNLISSNFFSNKSFDAGVGELTNSVSTLKVNEKTYERTIDVSDDFLREAGFLLDGNGAIVNVYKTISDANTNTSNSLKENSTTISYTLKDNDKSNVLSVDVVNLFDGNGPVFVTKGGATSCPYEGEIVSNFYNHKLYNPLQVGNGGEKLSTPTNRVYNSELSVQKNLITNVPESDAAIFMLQLKNTSETQTDLEFILDIDQLTLNGAETNIETNGVSVFLPFNETVEFPLEISKTSSSSRYKYENIKVMLYNPCASANEKDKTSIELTAEFKKSCSKVTISAPENNWIFNANAAFSKDINGNTTFNVLPITFTDFNADFNGFKKIDLQYRSASSSNWTKLQSYYGSEQLKQEAGDTEGLIINSSDASFTYNWDVVRNNIPDGEYEFRAISYCTDNITTVSNISSGTVNLNAPMVFGTPKPTDGILNAGEDVTVRFNENIFKRITTDITVTGLKNQQEIDHNVSVYLSGFNDAIELPNQTLKSGSFSLQFWFKDENSGDGKLVSQENGINVRLHNNHLDFEIGGEKISTTDSNGAIDASQYNFYSFVYKEATTNNGAKMQILENGKVLVDKELEKDLNFNTKASIFIGGRYIYGNIHDIRLWKKAFTPAMATVAKDVTLTGRELDLLGYWKLDEGHGNIGLDKARRKNAKVNFDWAIFPKGTAYKFENNEYLTFNKVGFVQPTEQENLTLSFWVKADNGNSGTIFSNGNGDDSEPIQNNGFRNKWAVNLKTDGLLELVTENNNYLLSTSKITDNKWHHIALVVRRGGTLNAYVDGNENASFSAAKIGGFFGSKIIIGGRLTQKIGEEDSVDNYFTGILDELRFWNTARSITQIKRDRYFEIDKKTSGLILYSDFNRNATNLSNGPEYHHLAVNQTIGTTYALLTSTFQKYSLDSPTLKPKLKFTNIPFSTTINGDEMIIKPDLTAEEWSLFEGEIIDFSVTRLSDTHFNPQLSPVTWSAFVDRQEIEWYTENQSKEIVAEKKVGETYQFTMDVVNIGGSNQPFTISSLPTWLKASVKSGTVFPNSNKKITFTVDSKLAMGNYSADVYLQTNSGYNDRLSFNLRVLEDAPDWSVDANQYDYGMNIISKIKINTTFIRDEYTKVGAFVDGQARGEAYLTYDEIYDSYFAYLTIYSNKVNDETVTFKIWDAVNGKVIVANANGVDSISFMNNEVLGTKTNPVVFANTLFAEQNVSLNKGWTWVSFYTKDSRFTNLNSLFSQINPTYGDYIKSQTQFSMYEFNNWNGSLTEISSSVAYKIKLNEAKDIQLTGEKVAVEDTKISINKNWNWLPFPVHRNMSIEDAMAFYEPTDGDLLKNQYQFAIYDNSSGWSGTLKYLETGTGYMIKSGKEQVFNYPNNNVAFKTDTNKNSKETSRKSNTSANNNFAMYSNTMSIVSEIVSDKNYTSVMVFDENKVLRGISDIVEIQGKKMSFITVFSNSNDTLNYVLANNSEITPLAISFQFKNDGILGNMRQPILLSTSTLALNDENLPSLGIYPNPFSDEIIISRDNTSLELLSIEIYNTLGAKVFNLDTITTKRTVINTQNLAKGVYLLRITDANGTATSRKIVKR